jgi:hypothetical protein
MRDALIALTRSDRSHVVQTILAILCAVLLHAASAAMIPPMSLGFGGCFIMLLLGSAMALVPFAVLGILFATRGDSFWENWLSLGLACIPVVFGVDILIVILLVSNGYGHFHI